MMTIASKHTLQAVPCTGNWRSLCAGTFEGFAGFVCFLTVEMKIPDDWRHQGLDIMFGFSNSNAVGAALVQDQEQEALQRMQ